MKNIIANTAMWIAAGIVTQNLFIALAGILVNATFGAIKYLPKN
ncbi:hypothetical protein [Chitinophaga nivalis]|uniref:Uncharacterized protein n=1 Tax=Chitinophaga nivalis TaxID=2991709 RepID=A0ABT3IIJ4_9BACT|nr:hypothetical protein [Chitinophaga nivalis]MCW3466522.1 hypothetical protein [Chitinophaga nivalis]MCW3483787.1 hypothetical protein [Chitinophaga nivalis]